MNVEKNKKSLTELIKEHDQLLDDEQVIELDLNLIKPNPFQPRKIFEDEKLIELATSIKEHGVFQPIIVKKVNDEFIIVAGERRYRAASKAGLVKIPAIIRAYRQEKIVEIALLENLQRENLTAIEEAYAYVNMMKHLSLTQLELSKRMSKSRAHITNIIGLLDLPENIQQMILNREISMGHARALSKLDDAKKIESLAKRVINEGLSVRQIESFTQNLNKKNQITRKAKPIIYTQYEKKINTIFGAKAKVNDNKITIEFDDVQKLNHIINKLID